MGTRNYGSEGYFKLREYIKKELRSLGITPKTHSFRSKYFPKRQGENIYAVLKGENPKLKIIVLGGHYDTRSIAEKEISPMLKRKPIMGANDGGSSVAVLLELARVLSKRKLERSIMFVFFDMEDDGGMRMRHPKMHTLDTDWIQGSIYFAKENILRKDNVYFGVLVDMVAFPKARFKFERYAYTRYPKLYEYVWEKAEELSYGYHFPKAHYGGIIDDHLPFVFKGIPFINIIDMNYPYHHKQSDTYDKTDAGILQKVGRLVEYVVLNPPKMK